MSRARHKEEHKRAGGGRIGMVASGNPDVLKEAEGKEPYAKGDERKRGGKVKKHKDGMHAEGHKPHHRMDRPKRARGGKVRGSDQAPFSSAHHGGKAAEKAGGEPD